MVSEFRFHFFALSAMQVNGAARCNRPKGPQQIKREAVLHPPRTTHCVSARYRRELGPAAWSITVQSSQIVEFTVISHHRERERQQERKGECEIGSRDDNDG